MATSIIALNDDDPLRPPTLGRYPVGVTPPPSPLFPARIQVATTITALNDDESESPLQLISRAPDTANAAGDETEQSEYDRVSAPGSAAPADQRLYRITVPPNAELCLSLNFEPQAHGAVEFELPLELAGVPRCAELRRLVHAEGLRARLGVSTTRVMMGPRIVRDPALPYCTSIEIFSQARLPAPLVSPTLTVGPADLAPNINVPISTIFSHETIARLTILPALRARRRMRRAGLA